MQNHSLIAYLNDAADREAVEAACRARHMSCSALEGGVDVAAEAVGAWHMVPEFLVLDMSESEDPAASLRRLAETAPEGETNVIAVGVENSIEVYRQLRRMGVAEYLVRPVTADALGEIIGDMLRDKLDAGRAVDPERLICVHSVRGGAGGSSVAAAIAHGVSKEHGKRTILIDFDLEAGTQYLNFGTDPTEGLITMFENPSRIDALFMERALESPSQTLSLLSAHKQDGEVDVADGALSDILIQAQRGSEMVIADLPARPVVGKDMMLACGHLVLVAPPTIAGLREVVHTMNYLTKKGFDGELLIVLNKVGELKQGEIAEAEFRKRTERKVVSLHFDARAASRTMVASEPMASAGGRPAKEIKALLSHMPTAASAAPSKGRKAGAAPKPTKMPKPSEQQADVDVASPTLFNFRGRRGRLSFFLTCVLAALLGGAAVGLASIVGGAAHPLAGPALAMPALIGLYWLGFSITAQRLHDLGVSGWWQIAWNGPSVASNAVALLSAAAAAAGLASAGGDGQAASAFMTTAAAGGAISGILAIVSFALMIVATFVLLFIPGGRLPNRYGPPIGEA